MRLPIVTNAIALVVFLLAFGAAGEASETALPQASAAAVGSTTRVPYGWIDFCGRRPAECAVQALPPRDAHLTIATWRLLAKVTADVNAAIEPISNFDHWGTMLDHWDYPIDGKGDCKIYALQKRKLLMQAGLPRQALLMTIVYDLEGDGHAILTVKTDRGDFVLDNLTDEVRPWDATGYRFLKRQAQDDPNAWVDLGGTRGPGSRTVASAGR